MANTDILPAPFTNPVREATGPDQSSQQPLKRKIASEEKETELRAARDGKRPCPSVSTTNQSASTPKPVAEQVGDDAAEQNNQPGHQSRRTVDRQPGNETQLTSNIAGTKTDILPEFPRYQAPQGPQNVQHGNISLLLQNFDQAKC